MKKAQDHKAIVKTIQTAAQMYKSNLVGKTFLYVFDGRYIEVIYKAVNFSHLTGVDSSLSARSFYQAAVRRQLQTTQIGFSDRHPFALCQRKLRHICELASLAGSESFMLEEITTETKCYKFGMTELHFSICMNREKDEEGREKGSCYVAESLRDEDCFSKAKNVYSVTHILMKPNDQKQYSSLLYCDRNETPQTLPETVKAVAAPAIYGE